LLSVGRHPTNGYPGRHRTEEASTAQDGTTLPSSVWIRCEELAAVLDCDLASTSTVSALVFPRFDADAGTGRLIPLDGPQARAALLANVEAEATRYDPFLSAWFPDTATHRRDGLIERLLAGVPCFALVQEMGQLAASTRLLIGAVA
jgi:hypothetical protein